MADKKKLTKYNGSQKFSRVLIVIRWPVGGIRTFIKYFLRNFPEKNFRFTIVGIETEGMVALTEDVGDIVDRWVLIPSDGKQVLNLMKKIRSLTKAGDIDLVHAQGFTAIALCSFALLTSKIPLIGTIHDMIQFNQFDGWVGALRRLVIGFSLNRCAVVHCVSNDSKNNVFSFFPSLSSQSVVVPNGIRVEDFVDAKPINLRDKLDLSESKILLGFFGRFMAPKGFKYLVQAIEMLQHSGWLNRFHVVCFGSGAFIREERLAIDELGLSDCFSFLPFVSDVSSAMKACDLIVMPSIWETCPLQPMEALCAGVPFVGSNCLGLREVLDDTPAVLVEPGDAQSLVDGILKSVEIGKEPFEEFVPIAASRFDFRERALEISKIYKRVLL
ncbi:glycosyltransferase family 4 protein [Marinobacter sp.]|uniref:glycosyltransferase family 4 protein n=1 Tax=Marinobacter sp. TaxID=50741 RepID=UPI0019CF3A78|nr:glycosyltransferase family 4 protein [Marinobacter sp.]MBD3656208.1 glycosyltransferase family 4 protein [Marinobacter sp.]